MMLADIHAKLETLKMIDERLGKLETTSESPVTEEPSVQPNTWQSNQIPGETTQCT